jgi:hypothetical protein
MDALLSELTGIAGIAPRRPGQGRTAAPDQIGCGDRGDACG